MNKIDYTQPDGFPLDESILAFLQDQAVFASQSAALAGPLVVVAGCVVSGGNAGNGIVYMGGELLKFIGGAIQPNVIIVETVSNLTFIDNGVQKPVVKTRYATFGNDGTTVNLWTDFKKNTSEGVLSRLDRLERIAAPFFPQYDGTGTQILNGGMVLWKKAANLIPAGWAEVVDWRGRLPMGYDPGDSDFNVVHDSIGGAKTHTLTMAELPAEGIDIPIAEAGTNNLGIKPARSDNDGAANANAKSANLGSGHAHNILNPFRIVVFIEYTGQ